MRNIRISIELKPLRIDVVITKPELVDGGLVEGVSFANRQAAVGVFLVAAEKTSAIKSIREWSRNEARLVLIAVACECIIDVCELMV